MDPSDKEFSRLADQSRPNLLSDFWFFLRHNKKWWLAPLLVLFLLLALLMLLSTSGIAPYIYTLF